MEVSGHLHLMLTGYDAGWASDPEWTWWQRVKSLFQPGIDLLIIHSETCHFTGFNFN
jgi:hypothetical protein